MHTSESGTSNSITKDYILSVWSRDCSMWPLQDQIWPEQRLCPVSPPRDSQIDPSPTSHWGLFLEQALALPLASTQSIFTLSGAVRASVSHPSCSVLYNSLAPAMQQMISMPPCHSPRCTLSVNSLKKLNVMLELSASLFSLSDLESFMNTLCNWNSLAIYLFFCILPKEVNS